MSRPWLEGLRGSRHLPRASGLLMGLGIMRIYGSFLAHRSLGLTQLIELSGQLAAMATPAEQARWSATFEGHVAPTRAVGALGLVLGLATMYAAVRLTAGFDRSAARLRAIALANAGFAVVSFVLERPEALVRTEIVRAISMRSGDGPSGIDGIRLLSCVLPAPSLTAGQLAMCAVAIVVSTLALAEERGALPAAGP